ncbi:alpha/beta-hydrolase [Ramicandelaber brevisporus]|nr:alpha/beta-hydrolase [Ramicandelaber brevisporus]
MVSSSLNFVNDKQAGRQLGLYWCAAKESTGFKDSNSLTNKAKHGERMILFVHGGGFTKLHPTVFEGLCYRISKATGLRIASVDYRLSPEHRFPAALYDIAASYWHLTNPNGPFRFNPQNVILAGDSAGGNLVLSFMAYIRDQLQIAECGDQVLLPQAGGAILISPYVDLNSDTPSWSLNSKYDVIGNPAKRNPMHPARMYTMPFLINHEYVSPINLKTTRGLPPLLIQYGGAELLYEDIMQFVEKVHADNDKDDGRHKCTQLVAEEYADMVHDFQLFQYLDESKRAIDSMAKWIKETLGS